MDGPTWTQLDATAAANVTSITVKGELIFCLPVIFLAIYIYINFVVSSFDVYILFNFMKTVFVVVVFDNVIVLYNCFL